MRRTVAFRLAPVIGALQCTQWRYQDRSSSCATAKSQAPREHHGLHICRADLIRSHGRGTFNEEYEVGSEIGRGSYGSVARASHRRTGTEFAIKRIQKSSIQAVAAEDKVGKAGTRRSFSIVSPSDPSSATSNFEAEVRALTLLDHPHVIRLVEHYEEDDEYILVLELCAGPDLFDHIINTLSKSGHFSEHEASVLMRHMLKGLVACHQRGIIHKDIKPENYMFRQGPASSLKMIDLGLSEFYKGERLSGTATGSVGYMAPEVLKGQFGPECDVWSIGVICFAMLFGEPLFPLSAEEADEVPELILTPNYCKKKMMGHPRWKQLTPKARDIVQRMLEFEPEKRITVRKALQHQFIQQSYSYCPHCGQKRDNALKGRLQQVMDVEPIYLETAIRRLNRFAQAPDLQRLALTILAHSFSGSQHASRSESGQFRKLFRAMSSSGEGRLTEEDIRQACEVHGIRLGDSFAGVFMAMDSSHEGSCQILQFMAAVTDPTVCHRPEVVDAIWHELDPRERGFIDWVDIERFMPHSHMTEADCAAIISEVSGADKVTYQEFKAMMTNYH
mmetsp:Transcript_682/g.1430  ORF Transcript_682/g.1430 Transcript_682/m.1430 type:complete len:561 (+) Transcript_682:79-1761(+)